MKRSSAVHRGRQRWMAGITALLAAALLATAPGIAVRAAEATSAHQTVEYSIVTSEIKSAPKGQQEIEVYRFSPSVVAARTGDRVILRFYGVKGAVHPITISALGLRTVVSRGEIKTFEFTAPRPGYYPIVCELHKTIAQHGPMIGMLVVVP